ncbi:MAG: methyltransferase domain-containing protein [Alphaproteobacteria bacterium]|nr:methyltransferase domain-containing protein [Alphaproteobacteria bacterium SS10]
MSDEVWGKLNIDVHSAYQGIDDNPEDPNWIPRMKAQASALNLLATQGVIPQDNPWVDWGAGDATLTKFTAEHGLDLKPYDKYISQPGFLTDEELTPGGFDLVISTSLLEHVMDLSVLDGMSDLVSSKGILAVHTLVREEVPKDPSWFYLVPVHVSMFTNKSMQILFDRWGYASSIYHVPSRLWFFFRDPAVKVEEIAAQDPEAFFAKRGFMDYWKL